MVKKKTKHLIKSKSTEPGMGAHAYNPSIQEVKAGELQAIQGEKKKKST